MAKSKLGNIPYSIGVPGGAPNSLQGVAMFLTQFITALNNWIYLVANILNNLVLTQTFGSVTEVNTGTGLTGGPIISTGTIALAATSVTPGTYQGITFNAQGQATAASNILTAKAATNKVIGSPGSVTATSPTWLMLGLAGTITPTFNTAIYVTICGTCSSATLADTITVLLSYGTSSAPGNGTAAAGTQGNSIAFIQAVAADNTPFSVSMVITGLSAGTAYWLDLAVGSSGGHAVSFGATSIAAMEV